ncbi:MAG: tRNA lysidine(34) synthetase TilS [Ruminococcaceae bacterium]|nr:tRNA lysidine(34) synthetase TilS [Oscillospiraceae bacterium]
MNEKSKKYSLPPLFTSPHDLAGERTDSPILVAFSGGADSGALLHMAVNYGRAVGAQVYAAHVNHGIRGAEADRDELFCKNCCESYGIRLFLLKADLPAIAKERGLSVETAARDVRYEFFSEIMRENSIPILAVAHNADDNLETVLFNISRGAALGGVCGIPRTRDIDGGTIVRPILRMSRREILRYCEDNSIDFVTDSTNTDVEYTRNRIRNRIIPELKTICPDAEKAAARMSESLRQDALCLQSMAEWFLEEAREGYFVSCKMINGSPYAITTRALMMLYGEISGGGTLEYTHVEALMALSKKAEPHSSLNLPAGIRAVIEEGKIGFTRLPPPPKNTDLKKFSVVLSEGENRISQTDSEIIIEKTEKYKNIYKKSMNLYLDSAKIVGTAYARERRDGDKIRICNMSKSVKKLMCEKKIPQELRPRIPMICDDTGIVAIPFIGVRDGYAPKDGCDTAISIKFDPK